MPLAIESPNGDVNAWQVLVSEGKAYFDWTDNAGSYVGTLATDRAVDDGRWHHFRADVAQSGSDIIVTLTVDGVIYGPSTIVGKTLNSKGSRVQIDPLKQGAAEVGQTDLRVTHCLA